MFALQDRRDAVLDRAFLHPDLGFRGREEAPAGEDAPLDVVEEPVVQQAKPFERIGGRLRRLDDLSVVDLERRVDRCELELLLRAEVGVQAALTHSDVGRKAPDRDAFEALDRGEVRGGAQDLLAAALAVRALPSCQCRSHLA